MSSEQDQVRLLAARIARRMAQSGESNGRTSSVGAGNVGGELKSLRETIGELQERLTQIESHMTGNVDERQSQDVSSVRRQETGRQETASSTQAWNDSSRSDAPATRSPWLSGVYFPVSHPSMEKFGVDEAAVSELVDFFEKEKTCSLEPGDKPCDHCAMCNSRGF
jgi:hypothetical protein